MLTSSCLRRQAYTVRHKVIKVTIEALARRVSQTGQCICTYTNENDVCQCAAKFSISAADRALAADELQRRHGITKRLPQLREQDSAPDCLAALQAEERAEEEAAGVPCAHAKALARQTGQKMSAAVRWGAARQSGAESRPEKRAA